MLVPIDKSFPIDRIEQAMRDGGEARVQAMLPDRLPPDIREIYDHAHET